MHGLHARLPKNFVLEERLERYADAIELCPQCYAGRWRDACHPLDAACVCGYERLHVDLGCGKGAYVLTAAAAAPDTLFVAVDAEPICIAYTAQHVMEAGLANVVAVPAAGSALPRIFAPGEVDALTLNFPTPFPRKKDAAGRLTILERLIDYRQVLAPGATVLLKTDSYPLWRFSRTQFELAGYDIGWLSEDAMAERPDDPQTEYGVRLSAQGAPIYGLEATPGADPGEVAQTASLSLVDYLPDDLESMAYVPHGMQGTVVNLRNRRRHRVA